MGIGVRSGNATLATVARGTGAPVVFLHANVCDSRMWEDQIDAVAATNRAIAYDRRGFGATRAAAEPHSRVDDLMAVLDAVADHAPAILVACSRGGMIAIDAALREPSRVRGLVLIAAGVGGAPEPAIATDLAALLAGQAEAERSPDLDRLGALKARLWLDGPLAEEGRVGGRARALFATMIDTALRSPAVGAALDAGPAYGRLGEIAMPALVAWGTLDFPHIQARCAHLASRLPQGSGLPLDGVSHLPSLERPDLVTPLVTGFVRSLDRRTAA